MRHAIGADFLEIVSDLYGDTGQRKACARVTCDQCGAVGRHWLTGRLAPELVTKHFEQIGWELGRRVSCPACVAAAKPKKEKTMTVVPIKEAAKARALTPDEKTKVRQKLDGCFDEQRGVYLDGQSDQKIGEALGIPWASVRDYRELAFGPLKGNEETAALKADIDKLAASIAAEMARSSKEIGELGAAKDRLLTRLNAIEKKLGFG